MITWMDPQTLQKLGLEHARWLDTIYLAWPGQVAEGRTILTNTSDAFFGAKRFAPLTARPRPGKESQDERGRDSEHMGPDIAPPERRSPLGELPETVPLKLEYSQGRIYVQATDSMPIKGVVIGEGTCEPQEDKAEVVFIGARRGMVQRLDGVGIVFSAEPTYLEVTPFMLPGEDVPGFAEVDVDLRPLLDATTDPWLRAELERYDTDPWRRVIACGLLLRYWSEGLDAAALESATMAYIEGVEPQAWKVVRQVTSAWGEEVQNTIVDFAISEIIRVQWELDELKECRPTEPDWVARFVQVCIARDDLESVRELLAFLGRHDINTSLAALDDEALCFVSTIPVGLDPQNPRLLRALAREPQAWWTSPVEDPQWYDLFGRPK